MHLACQHGEEVGAQDELHEQHRQHGILRVDGGEATQRSKALTAKPLNSKLPRVIIAIMASVVSSPAAAYFFFFRVSAAFSSGVWAFSMSAVALRVRRSMRRRFGGCSSAGAVNTVVVAGGGLCGEAVAGAGAGAAGPEAGAGAGVGADIVGLNW